MDGERRCDGSTFQTAGAATWKLYRPSCVLVEGTSMSWRSAERRLYRASDASDWDAVFVKVARIVLTDTVKCRDCYLWTHAQRCVHVIFCRCFLYFYGRLSWPNG